MADMEVQMNYNAVCVLPLLIWWWLHWAECILTLCYSAVLLVVLGIIGRHLYGTELCKVHCKTGWEKGTAQERSVHACRKKRHLVSFPFSTATGLVILWGRGSGAVSNLSIKLVECCKYLHRLVSHSWLDQRATDRCISNSGIATKQGDPWSFSLTAVIVGMNHRFSGSYVMKHVTA